MPPVPCAGVTKAKCLLDNLRVNEQLVDALSQVHPGVSLRHLAGQLRRAADVMFPRRFELWMNGELDDDDIDAIFQQGGSRNDGKDEVQRRFGRKLRATAAAAPAAGGMSEAMRTSLENHQHSESHHKAASLYRQDQDVVLHNRQKQCTYRWGGRTGNRRWSSNRKRNLRTRNEARKLHPYLETVEERSQRSAGALPACSTACRRLYFTRLPAFNQHCIPDAASISGKAFSIPKHGSFLHSIPFCSHTSINEPAALPPAGSKHHDRLLKLAPAPYT